jgi:hypothetical protein
LKKKKIKKTETKISCSSSSIDDWNSLLNLKFFSSLWFIKKNFFLNVIADDYWQINFQKVVDVTTLIDILWKKYIYKWIYICACDVQKK